MIKHQIFKTQSGVTFIELMIVITIIAILIKIAYPNYLSQVQKSHRTAAKTALLDLASREARYYSTNNVYTATLTSLGYPTGTINIPDSTTPYYILTLTQATTGDFTGTATPTGVQATPLDSCGTYTITNLGVKTPANTSSLICW